MTRRKKRETQCPDENPPAAARPAVVSFKSKHEYICEGCDEVQANDLTCGIYVFVPPYYIRHKCCPFNKRSVTVPKVKVRVGQQKTKSMRRP
jgi:hypothetical protein